MEAVSLETSTIFDQFVAVTAAVQRLIYQNRFDPNAFREPQSSVMNLGLAERAFRSVSCDKLVQEIFYEALLRREVEYGDYRFVLGYFNVPYTPSLGFDGIVFRVLPQPEMARRFPSDACPVIEMRSSPGFTTQSCVAIFPENFVSGGHGKSDRVPIYYMINRFLKRTKAVTLRFIEKSMPNGPFQILLESTDDSIVEMLSVWVGLHEHFHNSGKWPLDKFLALKSKRAVAGMEELRVDLKTIISLSLSRDPLAMASARLVFCERAFRYGLMYDLKTNFDAISSQVLVNYLVNTGSLSLHSDGTLELCEDWLDAVRTLSAEIDLLEETSNEHNLTRNYEDFARRWCAAEGRGAHQFFQSARLIL